MQIVVMVAILAAVWATLAPGKAPHKESDLPLRMAKIRKLERLRNSGPLVIEVGQGKGSVKVTTRDSGKILDDLIGQEKDAVINRLSKDGIVQ